MVKRKHVTIRARNAEDLRKKVAKMYPSYVIDQVRELTKVFTVALRPRKRG